MDLVAVICIVIWEQTKKSCQSRATLYPYSNTKQVCFKSTHPSQRGLLIHKK